MATTTLFKTHSKLAFDFLRKPTFFTRPHLASQIAQAPIIDEVLPLFPDQRSQHPLPALSLADFLGVTQKPHVGEECVLGVRERFQTNGSTLGGTVWARGRGGSSSRGMVDSEEEADDDDMDEFADEDFVDEYDENFDDDDDDDEDFGSDEDDYDDDDEGGKKVRRK